MTQTIALVLVLIGALLCLTASIGLLRFPDVPARLHAATKPQVLGMMIIAVGVAVALHSWTAFAFLVPVVLIQLATAPISAHMVARQAYRNGSVDRDTIVIDELADDIEAQRDSG
ncbi:Na+/H+ antiporter subunit G [Microbacterium nanhaiense]|uniref:Na+/H+ antiporter subunit G n=1 Tax=Microbacterium nanhaiense TaxID=1301026 RepID=A0ABQ2N2F5_9MICO|nr:monovalent cation/H(+) antiporter subunit G [Microbacterium nanhaiense]GGO63742.1 Na+/H+ antiporter subunit G [Microbacterium nanhaiense]